ncbi:pyruvate formate lyase family protein [Shigella flexneri]
MEGVKLENRTHAPVDFDTSVASTITSHDAGYINKALEKIVRLQTEAPLKRAIIPFGGIKIVKVPAKHTSRAGPMLKKSKPNTAKPTTRAYSMFTPKTF